MWFFQLVIFLNGMETIRKFIDFCGPAVYVVMFILAGWILWQAGISSLSLQLSDPTVAHGWTPGIMANAAMLVVAYFAALLLNFGDFARFTVSEREMKAGNFLGLPINFFVFALVTVVVTSGTVAVFGEAIMDPVAIVERVNNPIAAIIGSLTFIVATMGINIVANFVSPAYDFANLFPQKINFRIGGLITSILSVAVCPWLFVQSPAAITTFVAIFGSILGPMYGIMIADYYLVKREHIVLEDLYSTSPTGSLYFDSGWSRIALIAMGLSGFVSIGLALLGGFGLIYNVGDWGWLIGAVGGGVLYYIMSMQKLKATAAVA
jgi:nucleobase:cation symporter-1, NCS1 family